LVGEPHQQPAETHANGCVYFYFFAFSVAWAAARRVILDAR
jgi:hypothetical protein